MIEVFRNQDYTTVALIQGVLESEGIATELRNQNVATMTTSIPIPDMFPNLRVFHDADAERAQQIIHAYFANAAQELPCWTCPTCEQENDGNFAECWSCQTPAPDLKT